MSRAEELERLIDGAEQLLIDLADAHNPAIQTLRDRVDRAIADARRSVSREEENTESRLRAAGDSLQSFVAGYPWLALGSGMLVAAAVGFVLGASLTAKDRSAV